MTHHEETHQQVVSHERHLLSRRHVLVAGLAAATGGALVAGAEPVFAAGNRAQDHAALAHLTGLNATVPSQIAREVGATAINHTDRWGLYGADLGHMFLHRGKIAMVFGDSFGAPAADNFFSVSHSDWRSNTMAWIEPPFSPLHGLPFSSMITDTPGHAKELLSSQKVDNVEITVIPTYGVSVGQRMFLHYMSVHHWGQPGHWTLNASGLAFSDDDGQTWTKDEHLTWPGESNFGQVAIVEHEGYLYFFGIPGGRYGGVQLARVRPEAILTKEAYQYWSGNSWQTNTPSSASLLVPAPVGELSVRWNSYYRKWLMMYLNDPQYRIVLRTADALTGPWSEEQVITTGQQYPQLYAPYITPIWNDGPDIFFTMSMYGPYCVFLMRTTLLR